MKIVSSNFKDHFEHEFKIVFKRPDGSYGSKVFHEADVEAAVCRYIQTCREYWCEGPFEIVTIKVNFKREKWQSYDAIIDQLIG